MRLFKNNVYTLLATSASFTVQAPPAATLSITPTSVAPGATASAAWSNILTPSATDWIGLYAPGAADNAFISWEYTSGAASGSEPFNIAASVANGTYQLRLFAAGGYTRLATSANFSVGLTQKLHFIHVDHLNTPRAIYDDQQRLEWKWEQQEPFGVNVPDENPSGLGAFEFPVRFPGQYADKESGSAQNWMRDYSSNLGRYLQGDPVGIAGGLNLYLYVSARPTTRTDPAGLKEIKDLDNAFPEAYSIVCDAYALTQIRRWTRQAELAQQSLGPCERKCFMACFLIVQSELGECPRDAIFEIFPFNEGCERGFFTGITPGHWKCIRGTITGKSNQSCCRPSSF